MSAAKVKYAVIGAGSKCIYNIRPVDGYTNVVDGANNQAALLKGAARLYSTVEAAINAIRFAKTIGSLVVARVTITETPATLRVLDAGELIEPGDKFVLEEKGLFLKIADGFFRVTSLLEDATQFDTATDAALLQRTADQFLGQEWMFARAIRRIPGETSYTVEALS